MKHIKTYESIREDLKKGDIIIIEEGTSSHSYVYLVKKDVPKNKRKIDVYCFGDFQYESFNIFSHMGDDIYYNKYSTHYIYKGWNIRLVTEQEKLKIVFNIYNRIFVQNNVGYKEILNIIKQRTGTDLTQMPEYIEYADSIEMKRRTTKYNL